MPTTQTFRLLLAAALLCGWSSCCTPPAEDYIQQPYVQQQMSGLANAFLALLPPDQASLPAAGAEARWLADTAVVQSAAIARDNRTVLFGWLNNILVNSNLRDRGLCWQVQQDLYRDLRRRPVKYFRIGLTIRDRGTGREHSCVYVNAAGKGLQGSIVPEGHSYGMEHHLVWPGWARKRPMLVQRIFQSDQQNEAKAAAE